LNPFRDKGPVKEISILKLVRVKVPFKAIHGVSLGQTHFVAKAPVKETSILKPIQGFNRDNKAST